MKITHVEDYKSLRVREYPALSELGDAIYWADKGDDTKMQQYLAKIDAVKLKYPKPMPASL